MISIRYAAKTADGAYCLFYVKPDIRVETDLVEIRAIKTSDEEFEQKDPDQLWSAGQTIWIK